MYYRYYALMPSRSIRLVVKSPGDSQIRELDVLAKVERGATVTNWGNIFVRYLREGRDVEKERFVEIGKELFIWEMSSFGVSEAHVDAMIGKEEL